MNSIQSVYNVREDGKILTHDMTIDQVYALGEISTVVEVHWMNCTEQRPASLKSKFGVFATVVAGNGFIAAIVHTNSKKPLPDSQLLIVNPDGTVRHTVPNIQKINGEYVKGWFGWTDSGQHPADGVFGAIFQAAHSPSAQFRLDIDAATGVVLDCNWTR
jgi:hypothetical protein